MSCPSPKVGPPGPRPRLGHRRRARRSGSATGSGVAMVLGPRRADGSRAGEGRSGSRAVPRAWRAGPLAGPRRAPRSFARPVVLEQRAQRVALDAERRAPGAQGPAAARPSSTSARRSSPRSASRWDGHHAGVEPLRERAQQPTRPARSAAGGSAGRHHEHTGGRSSDRAARASSCASRIQSASWAHAGCAPDVEDGQRTRRGRG
jgi:hypothetical protein